jgi:ribA/ribD-fused uncharacterized protein
MAKRIAFYEKGKPYYEFTNFYPAPFYDEHGIWYRTSEHYFQSHKFSDTQTKALVRHQATAKDAFTYAQERALDVDPDWHDRKGIIMYKALRFKFSQNLRLRQMLLNTKDSTLVEDSPLDYEWGIGDGTGTNLLGKILMIVRHELLTGRCKFPEVFKVNPSSRHDTGKINLNRSMVNSLLQEIDKKQTASWALFPATEQQEHIGNNPCKLNILSDPQLKQNSISSTTLSSPQPQGKRWRFWPFW